MKLNDMSESLLDKLSDLRPDIAEMAQSIYDNWDQEGNEYGNNGNNRICDTVSTGIGDILAENDIDMTESGHEGDDHSCIVAYDDQSAYIVGVPYYLYESGAGYSWTKLDNVQLTPDDVEISTTEMPDWI
jgi:hypothetical protein